MKKMLKSWLFSGLAVRARFVRYLFVAAVTTAPVVIVSAQQPTADPTGRIVGRILDASTGRGVSEVGVQIVGTTLGGMSGVEGRYAVPNVPAGTVTIQVRRIGYAPKTITGILLSAG